MRYYVCNDWEYERGWGSKVIDHTYFPEQYLEEANELVLEKNKDLGLEPITPNQYFRTQEPVIVEKQETNSMLDEYFSVNPTAHSVTDEKLKKFQEAEKNPDITNVINNQLNEISAFSDLANIDRNSKFQFIAVFNDQQKPSKKLIRDKIPLILRDAGISSNIGFVDNPDELKKLLIEKLFEECFEFKNEAEKNTGEGKDKEKIEEELADIKQVIDDIIHWYGLSYSNVHSKQTEKLQIRGHFDGTILHLNKKEENHES